MAFGVYSLLEAAVLCLNAVCVLNEERFLSKLPGWGGSHVQGFGEEPGIKTQIFHFIRSVKTVMKFLDVDRCGCEVATDMKTADFDSGTLTCQNPSSH
ncbi:immediate early response 3-interacting protein 1-like isoform X1 [Scylla paramamosain]|uniref:immediate early response 3-interacting protein 1-like isoform X1 n=1 Tax=Scylla paramamosain TaxID=85552 RepID=UPI00308365BD